MENDKPYGYYLLSIKWITQNIINDTCLDGYIVQKLTIFNDTGINDISNKEYYEAWEVINGKCTGDEKCKYDDIFLWSGYDMIWYTIPKSIGKVGKIKYYSEVYWISKQNKLYKNVDNWESGTIPEARTLKSILVKDCQNLNFGQSIFKREFIHEVVFNDVQVIKETINNEVLKMKSNANYEMVSSLKEELIEINENPDNIKYVEVLNEIIRDL